MFNEDQQRLIVEFFADMKTGVNGHREGKKVTYRMIEKDSKWFPDLDEWLPTVNEVLSESPSKIKYLNPLLDYYNSTPYSTEKSRQTLTESLYSLSERFEKTNIPLIYTASLLPKAQDYPAFVWNELKTVGTFHDEDYGRIDFINALTELRRSKVIDINSFSILLLAPRNFVVKVSVKFKLAKKRPGKESGAPDKPNFDPKSRWEDVTITFQSEYEVKLHIGAENYSSNYEDMGFADRRTPEQKNGVRVKKIWKFLIQLSANNGVFPYQKLRDKEKVAAKKEKQALAKALRGYFGFEGDPFEKYDREAGVYKIRLKLIPEKTLRPDFRDRNIKDSPFDDFKSFTQEQTDR